jgi:sulfhydrogenase subunit alpha
VKRTIRVDYLARVEGEGALTIKLVGKVAEEVKLEIFEPPRLFEAFLRGRAAAEAPDLTARICGICPVAYQMSACAAVEDVFGVTISETVRRLRRLLYCGEWLGSHALHVFMLHLPDFLGYADALTLARDRRELVQDGLQVKKAGNAIVAALGGREIHPVNVKIGGFYALPPRAALLGVRELLLVARERLMACLPELAALPFHDFERDYEFVALRDPVEYPFIGGRLVSSLGLDIGVAEYERHFQEEHVPHSTALHSVHVGHGAYFCGPLARFNLNHDCLRPLAREAARTLGLTAPCRNPNKSLLVRLVEMVQAADEAIAVIDDYRDGELASADHDVRAAVGYGCSEAPRGLLYHRYDVDEAGAIRAAKIVPPTSQNQKTIELDLFDLAPVLAELPLDQATHLAEQAVRSYDPCISCSTHFLKLKIERREP